jgi:hypothetical protein
VEEPHLFSTTGIQDSPSNLTNDPISATTAIAIITQMPEIVSLSVEDILTGTTTTKTSVRTFFHSYRYPKN